MRHAPVIIGQIKGGGVVHRLSASLHIDPEELGLASYVIVEGRKRRYFALVYDVSYQLPPDKHYSDQPVTSRLPFDLAERINRKVLKATAELSLTLCIDKDGSDAPRIQPAVYLPPIHSPICMAQDEDIAVLFGKSDAPWHWVIGYTREQGLPVPLDLQKLLFRSTGIFGATGTGKSVLSRILLSGLIHKRLCASITYDMHNEFAFDLASESGSEIPGLKTIFGDQIVTFGLGRMTNIRGQKPDYSLEIALTDITPADIQLLTKELNLTDATATVTSALVKSFGNGWLREFLKMSRDDDFSADGSSQKLVSVPAWSKKMGVNLASAQALWSKLKRVQRRSYTIDDSRRDGIAQILTSLMQGRHVILSFGEYQSDLDYLLVTNVITRRVTEAWEEQAQQYRGRVSPSLPRLVVVLEEAHKLLNREMASQTVFGTLARELRKSNVVLWLIDQRPSAISDEVMSQVGTRISAWMGDDRDLDAVFVGMQAKDAIRRMLTSLQPNGQFVISGWAVPMPISLSTRVYDERFVRETLSGE